MTFTEYKTVEKEILKCLQSKELGWRYEPGDEVSMKYRNGDEQEVLRLNAQFRDKYRDRMKRITDF